MKTASTSSKKCAWCDKVKQKNCAMRHNVHKRQFLIMFYLIMFYSTQLWWRQMGGKKVYNLEILQHLILIDFFCFSDVYCCKFEMKSHVGCVLVCEPNTSDNGKPQLQLLQGYTRHKTGTEWRDHTGPCWASRAQDWFPTPEPPKQIGDRLNSWLCRTTPHRYAQTRAKK